MPRLALRRLAVLVMEAIIAVDNVVVRVRLAQQGWCTPFGQPICFYCRKLGHKQVHCRYRKRKQQFNKQKQNQHDHQPSNSSNNINTPIISSIFPPSIGVITVPPDKSQTNLHLDTLFGT